MPIIVNLSKSNETDYHTCNSDEETEEKEDSFIDLKAEIEMLERPVHTQVTPFLQRLDSSYLTSYAEW